MSAQAGRSIFVSYSHADRVLFDELMLHVKQPVAAGLMQVWTDRAIPVGERFDDHILGAMSDAGVAVLLISPRWLNSHYVETVELPYLQQAQARGLRLVPVYLHAVSLDGHWLAKLNAVNGPDQPIGALPEGERHVAYKALVERVRQAAHGGSLPPAAETAAAVVEGHSAVRGALEPVVPRLSAPVLSGVPALPMPTLPAIARVDFAELFDGVASQQALSLALTGEADPARAGLDAPYETARGEWPDSRTQLDALLRQHRLLLLHGPEGLGKTREAAELALRRMDDPEWAVCVARSGSADAAMGALAVLPPALAARRLLLVVDNLEQRLAVHPDYLDRLAACVESLRAMRGERAVRVLALAADLPPRIAPFVPQALPEFSAEGLAGLLLRRARHAGLALEADAAAALVADSDSLPRTLTVNVLRAQRRGQTLAAVWQPNGSEGWRELMDELRSGIPELPLLLQALDACRAGGITWRAGLLQALGRRLGGDAAPSLAPAVQRLVQARVLARDGTRLQPRSQALFAAAPPPADWLLLADAALDAASEAAAEDLIAIAAALLAGRHAEAARRVATHLCEHHPSAAASRIAAASALLDGDLVRAEAALADLVARDPADASAQLARMNFLILLSRFDEARQAIDAALAQRPTIELLRASTYCAFQQQDWVRVERDAGATAAYGGRQGLARFMRAIARSQLQWLDGAEHDFSAALVDGLDLGEAVRGMEMLSRDPALRQRALPSLGPTEMLALPVAETPLAEAPRGAGLLHGLRAVTRLMLGRWQGAAEDATAALALGHHVEAALMRTGAEGSDAPLMQRVRGQMAAAESFASVAFMRALRAVARMALGEADDALLADVEAALDGGLDAADNRVRKGQLLSRLGRADEAVQWLTACIAAQPAEAAALLYLRAAVHFDAGRMVAAVEDATAALALGGPHPLALVLRARARLAVGERDPALADAERALALAPDLPVVRLLRASLRVDAGDAQGGLEDLDHALAHGGDAVVDVHALRGRALYLLGRMPASEAAFARAVALQPAHPMLRAAHAETLLMQNRPAQALDTLAPAFASAGVLPPQLHALRGQALLRLERAPEALAAFDAARAAGQDDDALALFAGIAAYDCGEKDRARAELGRALGAGLEDAFALRAYLELQAEAGTPDLALDLVPPYLARWPADRDTRYAATWVLLKAGRFEAAEALVAARPADDPAPPDVAAVLALAGDRPSDAAPALAQLAAQAPAEPDAHLLLAEVLLRLDRRAEAVAELELAAGLPDGTVPAAAGRALLSLYDGAPDGADIPGEGSADAAFMAGLVQVMAGRGDEGLALCREAWSRVDPVSQAIFRCSWRFWSRRPPGVPEASRADAQALDALVGGPGALP